MAKVKPQRIQRKRTKGWRMPPNTVCVGRGTKWGNRYEVWREDGLWWVGWHFRQPGGHKTRPAALAHAVRLFRRHQLPGLRAAVRRELRDKNLACWCRLDGPCHGDPLLELANRPESEG